MKTGLSRKRRTELHLSEHDWKQLYPRRKSGRPPRFAYMEKLTGPAPCFYFLVCRAYAVVAKDGKGVCRGCAEEMKSRMPHRQEYPLGTPVPIVNRALGEFAAARGEFHPDWTRRWEKAAAAAAHNRAKRLCATSTSGSRA